MKRWDQVYASSESEHQQPKQSAQPMQSDNSSQSFLCLEIEDCQGKNIGIQCNLHYLHPEYIELKEEKNKFKEEVLKKANKIQKIKREAKKKQNTLKYTVRDLEEELKYMEDQIDKAQSIKDSLSILENGDKEEINKLEPNFQSYYRKVKQMEIIIEKTNEYINKNRDYLSLFKMPVSLEVLEYELEKYEGMKSKDEKENEEMVEEMNKSFQNFYEAIGCGFKKFEKKQGLIRCDKDQIMQSQKKVRKQKQWD